MTVDTADAAATNILVPLSICTLLRKSGEQVVDDGWLYYNVDKMYPNDSLQDTIATRWKRNRLIMSGMHTRKAQQVGNRILLTSLSDDVTKDHMNQTLMDHITGGMKPKQRAQLLVDISIVVGRRWLMVM